MKSITVSFACEQDKIDFVNRCERDFEERLTTAIKKVIDSNKNIVLLSGPTCSGKTTTAKKLIDDFESIGKKVTIISIDDFFKERNEGRIVDKNKKIDYDSVDVLDVDLLKKCIKDAKAGNVIRVPIFDFISQKRIGVNVHEIEENEILMFEGIQAVYPDVYTLFDKEYEGVFINVCEDVCVNGIFFSKHEIRLIRRIVRDRKFRGASPDFTFFLWETVRENEDKSIFPNKDICQVQIDSFMGYELFLMKNYIQEALSEIPNNSPYYSNAKILMKKFDDFDEISYDYIPDESLYTEFLGKNRRKD
ncbi:MAG: Flp pilus assembly complex ATPase component TadA [Clostridia bacterium]|nr:Flp pilus assembly complex ATPase component TadA [Clostridia bacterium]